MSRSPFFYVGDKYKLMKQLNRLFPKNINRLIEPFCGGGSVFLNSKANYFIANDNNEYVIKLHNFLLSYRGRRQEFFELLENKIISANLSASALNIMVDEDLKKQYVKTYYAVYNKTQYNKLKEEFNQDKENLLLLYILLIYGFNHMIRFNKSGVFNLPVGNVDYNQNVKEALNNYFDFIEKNDIEFQCFDFEDFIKSLAFQENDLVYIDPPYLISSSEYNKDWGIAEEQRLLNCLDWLNERGVKFALSNVLNHKGKTNELLIEWAKKYKVTKIKSNYISYHDNTIKKSREVLITNYEKKGV